MTDIKIGCIAIPDGRRAPGGNGRVSVLLTPDADLPGAVGAKINLDHWPKQISALGNELRIAVTHTDGTVTKHHFKSEGFNNWPQSKRNEVIESSNNLWRQIFRDYNAATEKYRFDQLRGIFEKPKPAAPGLLRLGRHTVNPENLRFTGTYALTKSITRHKEMLIAARYLYAAAVSKIRAARGENRSLAPNLSALESQGPVAALLARPFADPLLEYRLQSSAWFSFSDLRPDAMGRLNGLADRAQGGAFSASSSFLQYAEAAKGAFKAFSANALVPKNTNADKKGELPKADAIASWLEMELSAAMPPGQDLKPRADKDRDAALMSLFRSQLVAQELANPIEPKPRRDRASQATKDEDDLRRKFAGIRSFPMLAKFLGFIVDVEVPFKPADSTVFLVAGFGTEAEFDKYLTSPAVVRTACLIQKESFVAASNPAVARDGNDYKIENGLLSFGSNKDEAYSIQTVDGTLLLQSFAHDSANLLDALNNGAMLDTLNSKLPETQVRGLQIIHKNAQRQAVESLKRATARTKALAASATGQTLYAENLLIGFRLDARRTKINTYSDVSPASSGKLDWASLIARKVLIHEISDAFPGKPEHPYEDCRERDFGMLRRVQKQVPVGSDQLGPAPSQVLATWMGDHLGVPTPQFVSSDGKANAKSREAHVHNDLGVSVDYSFSDRVEDIAPVLRIGDGYEFGLRAVMPNGASISLADAKKRYTDEFVLGSGAGPYNYRFFGDIRPPQALLPQEDPLARPISVADMPNERDDRIVLRQRSGHGRQRVRRFLVPGRISFEQAEQFGLLDDQTHRKVPLGAFRRFRRDRATGAFPAVKGGSVEKVANHEQPVTGTVLIPLSSSIANEPAPYYPDALGRNLKVMFERNRSVPDGFEEESPSRSFWKEDDSPLSAMPILLEIRTNDALGSGGRFLSQEDSETIGGVKFPKLTLEIAPAESVTLWYWALPDDDEEKLLCGHTLSALLAFNNWQKSSQRIRDVTEAKLTDEIAAYLMDLRDKPASRGVRLVNRSGKGVPPSKAELAVQKWMKDLQKLPSFDTKGWGKIDVVYAVEKPLRMPLFRRNNGMPEFNPVRIAPENKWDEDLIKNRIGAKPPFVMKSERGGTTVYFTGAVEFDRRSTLELTADFWCEDFSDARSIRLIGKKWQFAPAARFDQLFQVKAIPIDHGANEPGIFDLARDEAGALRGLSYDFGQITSQNATAAHEISVRLVASSRFEREFDRQSEASFAQFEQESRSPFRKSAHIPGREAKGDSVDKSVQHDFTFWIRSTERPPKPNVERVAWISPEKTTRTADKIIVERWCCPRIYLSRPWFVSGADELLAVICAPPTLVDNRPFERSTTAGSLTDPWNLSTQEKSRADDMKRLTLKEFQKGGSLASIAEHVTRWGADPTTESGKLEPVISAERFRGFVATVQNLPLPLAKAERPTAVAQNRRLGIVDADPELPKVSAFLYKPEFDEDTGLWYVDIGIDPGAAHMPFVQFSIARYQPHSLDGLSLSEPVVMEPIQIPAKRTIEIDLVGHRRVVAKVHGVGYVRRAPFNTVHPPVTWRELTDAPLQNVQLMRRDEHAKGPVAAFDIRGQKIEKLRVQPISNGPELIWICPFNLPTPSNAGGRYYIQFDEIELHIPDEDLRTEVSPMSKDFFVEKPAMFSCKVAL
jgi:hypothetical protein